MAKLKAVVDKLEDVPESAREFYTKTEDGRFLADIEGVDAMPAVRGLVSKRDELLGKLKEVTTKYDGIDPEEARSLKGEIEKLRKGGGDSTAKVAELEARIKQLTETSATEVKAAKEAAAKESAAAQRYFMRSEINRVLAAHGGDPDLLSHLIEGQVKVVRVGDDFKLSVVDAQGHPRIKNAANETMTVDDLIPALKEKKPAAFAAQTPSGSGASGGPAPAPAGAKTIKASDKAAISKNIKGIADGSVTVIDG